ncbi:hypothetical protein [Hafnia phage TS33]|nr:hypothetical protein [Hafnia phage TS33]
MTERKLFEREIVFLSAYPVRFDLDENGNYKDSILNYYWVVWQRARNLGTTK